MTALRTAAQQALEACEQRLPLKGQAAIIDELNNLRAALAQQAEPEEPVAQYSDIVSDGGMDPRNKYDTAPPAREWVSMDEYKRLQGLVTSQGIRLMEYESKQPQQAEPVEPVATVTECEACFTPDVCQLRGTCDYYTASQMRIAAPPQQAEPDHETRAELAEQQVVQLAEERDHYRNLWQKAQQAEPEEPVAWRVQRSDGQYELYFVKASAERAAECYIKRPQVEPLYTAPPQRKLVPLTEEEINRIDACIDESTPLKEGKSLFARAIENASWEKNHGQT